MKIKKRNNYTYIKPSLGSVIKFYDLFLKEYQNINKNHIVIDFSEFINIKNEELLLFLNLSKTHKKNKFSFILVCPTAEIDELPYELSVVPTILEAEDLIEIDNIERELGF